MSRWDKPLFATPPRRC